MATSLRGSATGEREKRGTSPSKPILKKSLKPSSSSQNSPSSSTNEEKINEPTETTKPLPNYLKPTMSSKQSSSDTSSSQKPVLNRRRSFDRPPPSSQVQRAIRPSSGSRETKPQRSSSFSSKSITPSVSSTRPTSEKLYARTTSLKDKKAEEPRVSRSRSVKKSTLTSTGTRKEPSTSSSSSTKKAPTSVTSESSIDTENPSVDHVTTELDDLVNLDDNEVQSLPEMSEMPDGNEELADPTNIEVEGVKHVEEDPKGSTLEDNNHHDHLHEDSSTIVDDQVVLEETTVDKETDDHQTLAEESTNDQLKVEAAADQNLVEGTADQNLVEGAADQQDEAGIEKSVPEVENAEIVVEEKKEEEKEKETVTKKEDQEETDEKQIVSSPPVDAAVAPANAQSSAGKKDKQVYNDVIEETATKLRGKKNKVLALAGAFETVISLQDTNKG